MTDVVVATSERAATALEAVEQHHAAMAAALTDRVEALLSAVESQDELLSAVNAKADLTRWCDAVLIPHARAEENALYRDAHGRPEACLLVDGMLAEHRLIGTLVGQLRYSDGVRAAVAAHAIRVVFELHLAKADDPPGDRGHRDGVACAWGETDNGALPELDVRSVPQPIRHETVFGALETVRPGSGMVLLAPHDPLPLLRQLEKRQPGVFAVEYLQHGPDTWRLALLHRADG